MDNLSQMNEITPEKEAIKVLLKKKKKKTHIGHTFWERRPANDFMAFKNILYALKWLRKSSYKEGKVDV